MKKLIYLNIFLLFIAPSVLADQKSAHDLITSMKGCYEVTFHFIETGTTDPTYPIHSKEYNETALEWIELDLDQANEVHLQHILVTNSGALKHWRQEWQYEPTTALQYQASFTWDALNFTAKETAGKWLQRVYQVDDSPRYECLATWSKNSWQCSAYSPLPRREFSKRSDYNILDRTNHHIITKSGWIHSQDNRKIILSSSGATQIATEYGLDTYTKVEDKNCKDAQDYWAENKTIWHSIQDMWRQVRSHHPKLEFLEKVDGKTLWSQLFDLAEAGALEIQTTGKFDVKSFSKKTHDLIHLYFVVH